MKLEEQVTSLELSKELRELGVKQESLFYWETPTSFTLSKGYNLSSSIHYSKREFTSASAYESISAFTVAELGEMLPREIKYDVSEWGTRGLIYSSGRTIINEGHYILYSDPHPANKVPIYSYHADTEADARAKMLIYLLKNKLITL